MQPPDLVVENATRGLIETRRGDPEKGIQAYREALSLAAEKNSMRFGAEQPFILGVNFSITTATIVQRVEPILDRHGGRLRGTSPDIETVANGSPAIEKASCGTGTPSRKARPMSPSLKTAALSKSKTLDGLTSWCAT
jgi:hypothetical protein